MGNLSCDIDALDTHNENESPLYSTNYHVHYSTELDLNLNPNSNTDQGGSDAVVAVEPIHGGHRRPPLPC